MAHEVVTTSNLTEIEMQEFIEPAFVLIIDGVDDVVECNTYSVKGCQAAWIEPDYQASSRVHRPDLDAASFISQSRFIL